jgi:hypothetical protein
MRIPEDQMKQHLAGSRKLDEEDQPQQTMRVADFRPAFMDGREQPRTFDPASIQAAYQGFEEEEDDEFELPLEEEYEDEAEQGEEEDDEYLFSPPPDWMGVGPQPTPPSLRSPGAAFMKDEPLFEGGPLQSEISSWKKQFEVDGHTINLSEIAGERFIWRSLNRMEYREIMALPNLDPLQREEVICEVCVLWPYGYNFKEMASRKAGIPAQLAEQIMAESGFARVSPPVRL